MFIDARFSTEQEEAEISITGIAMGSRVGNVAAGKKSSKKEWKLSDSLREKITGCGAECLYGQ